MRVQIKNVFAGVLVAESGAYVWLFWFALLNCDRPHRIATAAITAAFGIPLSALLVVPLGAGLGLLLPQLTAQLSLGRALLIGMLLGLAVASLTALLVTLVFATSLVQVFATMLPVCSLVLCAWVCLLKHSEGRSQQSSAGKE